MTLTLEQMALVHHWRSVRPDAFPAGLSFGDAYGVALGLQAEDDAMWARFA